MGIPDYYDYLEIPRNASDERIRDAIVSEEAKLAQQAIIPDQFEAVANKRRLIERIKHILFDPQRKAAYDRQLAEADDVVLELEYRFTANDYFPTNTVPELAHKLDENWTATAQKAPRAVSEALQGVLDQSLQRELRYAGQNYSAAALEDGATEREAERLQRRYVGLADQIAQYVTSNGDHHAPLLESVIALCDPEIERPTALIGDAEVSHTASATEAAPTVVRPDKPAPAQIVLRHGPSRGCLFGYCWLEESWGTISQVEPSAPPPPSLPAAAQGHAARYFELLGDVFPNAPHQVTLTIQPQAAALMQLPRPNTYLLTLNLLLQPDTPHEWRGTVTAPFAVTLLPSKVVFEPTFVTVPIVRRGERVSAVGALRNLGEQPMQAQLVKAPAQLAHRDSGGVTVDYTIEGDGMSGEARITIDTSGMRTGETYERTIAFSDVGDNPLATIVVQGTLYPTAFQHVFRQRQATERFVVAIGMALVALLVAGIGAATLPPLAFVLLSCAAVVGAVVGDTAWVARSVVRHIQGSGDTTITYASIRWRELLIGASIAGALLALLVSVALGDTGLIVLLMFLAAVWGFFLFERPSRP